MFLLIVAILDITIMLVTVVVFRLIILFFLFGGVLTIDESWSQSECKAIPESVNEWKT